MRLCAALALVLLALVVVTVKMLQRPHARRGTPPPDIAAATRLEPVERTWPAIALPRSVMTAARRTSPGTAHLHGRVRLPAGREGATELRNLVVTADDGARTIEALIGKGGLFALHVPAGGYTLTAQAGDLAGELRGVALEGGDDRAIEILLGVGAAIGGRLLVPEGATVAISVRPAGGDGVERSGYADNDAFAIDGLIPGRRYDVELSGPNLRTLKLTAVTAPAEALYLSLEPRAIVRIAIGFPRGERCPIDTLKVRMVGVDDEIDKGFVGDRRDCRFELAAPVDAGAMTLVAQGGGWLLQTEIAIPEHGDPEPICLNPPCRANPSDGLARLRVALDGANPGSGIIVDAVPVNPPDGEKQGCRSTTTAACTLEGLLPGETFAISAVGNRCYGGPVTATVGAGDNDVRIRCPPEPRVEDVLRAAGAGGA